MDNAISKRVKKLVHMNRFSADEIAKLCGVNILDLSSLYKQATGSGLPETLLVIGHDDEISQIKAAIVSGKHVILHGLPGIGKSITAKKVVQDLKRIPKEINLSDNRTGDLLANQLFGCHKITSDVVYIFEEIDNFHWQSHAYFLSVLKEAATSIIMTCNEIGDVSKEILNHVKKNGLVLQFYPPTLEDLENLITKKFPMFEGRAKEFYDPDFREVLRRMEFEWRTEKEKVTESKAQDVAGAILGNRSQEKRLDIIKECKDPPQWALTWVDSNISRFVRPDKQVEMLDQLSMVDRWARRTDKKYLATMLSALPCPGRKGKLDFPAALFNAEKKPEKKVEEVDNVVKVEIKEKIGVASTADPFAEF